MIQDISTDQKHINKNYPFRIEEEIIMSLKIGDTDNIQKYIQNFFGYYLEKEDVLPSDLKQACLQLYYTILKKMLQWNYNIEQDNMENRIRKADTVTGLKDIIYDDFIYNLIGLVNKEKEVKNNNYVKITCNFIKENYREDLSLEEIADTVYLSPNYLANIFKEKIGKTIISYLTDVRIGNAKDLLINTKLKVYEVAKKVGYKNSTYFGQVFKKKTNYSPQEYRNKNIKNRKI